LSSAAAGFWLFVSLLLQSTVLHRLAIAGTRPDLLLVLTIITGLLQGTRYGAAVGFIGGLMQDILIGRFLGMNALVKMIIGYLVGMTEEKVFKENFLTPFAAVLLGTLLSELLLWFLFRVYGRAIPFSDALLRIILPGIGYNCLVAVLCIARLNRVKLTALTYDRSA
jgi:rod shape-determining protein MreD